MARHDGNADPEVVFDFLLALLYDAGGSLPVSREAADWVHELRQRGASAGYRTEGSPDGSRLTLHLVSPDHPAT